MDTCKGSVKDLEQEITGRCWQDMYVIYECEMAVRNGKRGLAGETHPC